MSVLTYADWSELLAGHLLRPENSGRPVFLFVDDGAIGTMAAIPDQAEAVDAFVTALRREMGTEADDSLFRSIVTRSVEWFESRATGPPYCLPLLAATVLAASRMAAEGRIGQNNFYVRLRDLLSLPGRNMPRGFDAASDALWPRMHTWLDDDMHGELGRSMIPAHPRPRYVGPPISQALWRAADRQHLFEYLESAGRKPGQVGDIRVLVADFKHWARQHGGLGPGARLMLERLDLADQARMIIGAEAISWDGSAAGRVRSIPIRPLMRINPLGDVQVRFVTQRPPGAAEEAVATDPSGRPVALHGFDDWYELDTPTDAAILRDGLTLVGDDVRFVLERRPLHLFIQEPAIGGWLGVSTTVEGRPVRILVGEHLAHTVETYLSSAATPVWRQRSLRDLPGWVVFETVHLLPERPIPDDARLARLRVPPRDAYRLEGGLRLGGQRTYLIGGEPDVQLLPAPSIQSLPVLLDDILVGEATQEAALPLRDRAAATGEHVLAVGGTTMTLTVTDGTGPGEPVADRPWRRVGTLSLCGALIKTDSEAPTPLQPTVLRRGYQYELFGAEPGQIVVIPGWVKPRWMNRVGLEPVSHEVWLPFRPVWKASRMRQIRRLRLIDPVEPAVPSGHPEYREQVELWARWILRVESWFDDSDVDGRALLERYARVARRLLADA